MYLKSKNKNEYTLLRPVLCYIGTCSGTCQAYCQSNCVIGCGAVMNHLP